MVTIVTNKDMSTKSYDWYVSNVTIKTWVVTIGITCNSIKSKKEKKQLSTQKQPFLDMPISSFPW